MKITGIEIGEYRQFKNIKFDFTYPEWHDKKGQPLEKVCFIGQSGTGKTTLLNVIWEFFATISQAYDAHANNSAFLNVDSYPKDFQFSEALLNIVFQLSINNQPIDFNRADSDNSTDKKFLGNWLLHKFDKSTGANLISTNKVCIFLKDSIAREADAFLTDQKPDYQSIFGGLVKTDRQVEVDKQEKEQIIKAAGRRQAISLGDGQSLAIWEYLLREINHYDETGRELAMNIIQKAGAFSADKMISELVQWKSTTPNPRVDLAEKCLNPILQKLFLSMDLESTEVPLKVKTSQGVKIDNSYLSTGTRQILSTAIPIYKFNTQDTVILFDEPERSLFPDVQRDLVKYYTSLAPQAQFFFATHSPIIASAFEPCERFILYFDENGEVNFHNGVAPEGDDPNDILRQDFDMAELMLQKGLEAYEEYRRLAMAIRAEIDETRKNELIAKRVELGNRYNF